MKEVKSSQNKQLSSTYLKSLVDNNSLILVIILLLMWEQLPKQKSATLIFDICKLLIEM